MQLHRVAKPIALFVVMLGMTLQMSAQGGPQCGFVWQSVGGYRGADGIVECAVEWDPDGAGPAPTLAVLGGQFSVVGTAVAARIAIYEPITDTWSGLGGGMDGPVYALLPLPNGELIAAGEFAHAGGVSCNNIARWDGVGWQALGGVNNGTDGLVVALALLPNGEVVAGGAFASAGGVAAANVARFDGTSWSQLGAGCNARVNSLMVAASGELFVGGRFTAAGGVASDHLAAWNGSWNSIANGAGAEVRSIASTAADELVVAVASPECVRVWDGVVWSTRAGGFTPWEGAAMVRVLSGGQLVAGTLGVGEARLLTWDGSAWSSPSSPADFRGFRWCDASSNSAAGNCWSAATSAVRGRI